MTYSAQASAAKVAARDILRTEMAARIQERAVEAKVALTSAIVRLVQLTSQFTKDDTATAKHRADLDTELDADRQAIGTVEGLTPDEVTLVTAEFDKEVADLATERAEEDAARVTRRADKQKAAQTAVDEARADYEKTQANLTKLEAGELKVKKEELDALTKKLLEDGRIPAGTKDAVVAPTPEDES